MTLSLLVDTETTGLVQRDLRSDDPAQPHMVELGAILFDEDTGKIRSQLSVVVRPEGWTIPEGAARVHGITTEIALRVGVPLKVAVRAFAELLALADRPMAYNLPFDRRILRTAYLRSGGTREALDAIWKYEAGYCVMHACTPIVNLPPTAKMQAAGFTKPKSPRLMEAYRHFHGCDFEGAHGALSDCHATLAVYRKMNETTQPAERSVLPASAGEEQASGRAPESSPAIN